MAIVGKKHLLYLDYSVILPHGAPPPDMSGQPELTDFVPEELWNNRFSVTLLHLQGQREHPDVLRFNEATTKWLEAVQRHYKDIETTNGIEFCNWTVHSTPTPLGTTLWIQHATEGPEESKGYDLKTLIGLLTNKNTFQTIPGWDTSTPLQQQAVTKAIWLHLFNIRPIPG